MSLEHNKDLNEGPQTRADDRPVDEKEDANEVARILTDQPQNYSLDIVSLIPISSQPEEASFNAVPFPNGSSDFDKKYASEGRYGFASANLEDVSKLESQALTSLSSFPKLGYQAKCHADSFGVSTGKSAKECKFSRIAHNHTTIDGKDEDISSKSSTVTQEPYEEDIDQDTYERASRKRKRSLSSDKGQAMTPLSSVAQTESSEEVDKTEITTNISLLSGKIEDAMDFLTSKWESKTSRLSKGMMSDEMFLQVARMVADQAVSSTNLSQESSQSPTSQSFPDDTMLCHLVQKIMTHWSLRSNKSSRICKLRNFVGPDDQDPPNAVSEQGSSVSQRYQKSLYLPRAPSTAAQMISKLQSPYTCVQRSDGLIDIDPLALRFWEELSLEPAHGSKDVTAFCVYPAEEGVQDEVLNFLSMVKGVYQSCKLGLHDLGVDHAEEAHSLIPVSLSDDRSKSYLVEVQGVCEDLGTYLGKCKLQRPNTIVYMINPSNKEGSLPYLCTAFLKLFNAYKIAVEAQGVEEPSDVVLQVVPSRFIYSEAELITLSPVDYRRLAFEVYDRCGPKQRRLQHIGAPSIRLAKALPKSIDFRLTPEDLPLSLQNENCLHVAYAWDLRDNWLTAAWTDNLGVLSWTACYCLPSGIVAPWQALSKIAKEIWETSMDMLQPRHGLWRIIFCKNGTVYKHEWETWQSVILASSKYPAKSPVSFALLTVDTNPILDFPYQMSKDVHSEFIFGSLETPGDTPQTSAPSPDISGIGSTPGGGGQVGTPPSNTAFSDHDGDARLVDITDETWGVVMTHNVDDLCVLSDSCPALVTGYLLKRAGPRDEDGVVRLGVNVIRGQKPHRQLLKNVLGLYRNLGLLARIRGVVDSMHGLEPYHIAVVRRSHEAVTLTMHYEDG